MIGHGQPLWLAVLLTGGWRCGAGLCRFISIKVWVFMFKAVLSSVALLVAVLGLSACSGEPPDTHPDQPVTKRRAVFKDMVQALEPMGMVARDRKAYDAAEFLASAVALQQLAGKPWPLFTADSNYPPTHAKAAVWDKPAEFKQAQDKFQANVVTLVQAARGTDLDAIKASVSQVQQSCKACHDNFRTEK